MILLVVVGVGVAVVALVVVRNLTWKQMEEIKQYMEYQSTVNRERLFSADHVPLSWAIVIVAGMLENVRGKT